MNSLEEELRKLATNRGVGDQDARELAREFASRIRSLAAPDPDPDILIRERGDTIIVRLSGEDRQRAEEILQDHIDHGSYEFSGFGHCRKGVEHTFQKEEPEKKQKTSTSNEDKSLEEQFAEMSDEEQEIFMAKILDQH